MAALHASEHAVQQGAVQQGAVQQAKLSLYSVLFVVVRVYTYVYWCVHVHVCVCKVQLQHIFQLDRFPGQRRASAVRPFDKRNSHPKQQK